MLRKSTTIFVLLPLAMVLIVFAVANRQAVTVSLDPFGGASPALSFSQPLFLIMLACAILGVIVGGAAAWLRQHRWRRAARHFEAEAAKLRAENETLKHSLATAVPAGSPALPRPSEAANTYRPPAA